MTGEVASAAEVTPIVALDARVAPAVAWDGPLVDEDPARHLAGIGPARAASYAAAGLETRRQLLFHLPVRYRIRRAPTALEDMQAGVSAALVGQVVRTSVRRRGRRSTVSLKLACEGGGEVTALVFNRPYLAKGLRGERVWLGGKLDDERERFLVADYERLTETGPALPGHGLLPVYRLPVGVPPRVHRKVLAAVLGMVDVPDWRQVEAGEPDLDAALRDLHVPVSLERASAARQRLARDEAYALSLEVALRRRHHHGHAGVALALDASAHARLLSGLPHVPTAAQARCIDDVRADLAAPSGRPMARLLQGDVGSGKTQVALYALLAAAMNGRQGALMAPTEILANQHATTLRALLGRAHRAGLFPREPAVAVITGSGGAAERRAAREALATGAAALAVGTHGLQSKSVTFRDLAVTVVDEQHRFGVRQRVRLRGKGAASHLLVMTATPIPRTLALTAYGELDVSVIDELPPGRAPRRTSLVPRAEHDALWDDLRRAVADGERGYIVCPSITGSRPTSSGGLGGGGSGGGALGGEDGEPDEAEQHSVEQTERAVRRRLGASVRVAAVHGRLDPVRQREVLEAFRAGAVDVLVATVLIEVGLDVPEATFVVVPDPSRFGLATLHQIRGRVGRGERPGRCFLLGPLKAGPARARAQALVASDDGFVLAEQDLALRGPGELLGTRQSGIAGFCILDPVRDVVLLAETRAAALSAARPLSDEAVRRLRRRAFPVMDLRGENLLAGG